MGLFADFIGKEKNQPVIRFGNVSLITDEKVKTNKKGEPVTMEHLYLVECMSLGGFSGSPVFFETDRIKPNKIYHSPQFYLGGIMKGHYNDIIETHGIVRELNQD